MYIVLTARSMPTGSTGTSDGSVTPGSAGMSNMSGKSIAPVANAMMGLRPWTATEFGLVLIMWAMMMVAMMVPTAVPMTLVYAAVARKAATRPNPLGATFVFVGGYIAIWTVFSLVGTIAQFALDRAALLSPMMVSTSAALGAALLMAAGIYQFTPVRDACLQKCRTPAYFIAQYWRNGTLGGFRMGLWHGVYCVGCCWILMALMFVGGVMNLLWMAAIAVFVLLEKTIPFGEVSGKVAGVAMILAGALSLAL
jgi:predicted metal-binding membrane protein